MEKQRKLYAIISVVLVSVCVIFFFGRVNSGGYKPIVLPPEEEDTRQEAGSSELNDLITMVAVTPDTVQDVIASLSRPESYSANLTVLTYWSGGSGSVTTAVAVRSGLTRADTTGENGQVRHVLTDGKQTAVWYNNETAYTRLVAGQFDADDEINVPSYEDVLELDAGKIQVADYRYYGTVPCVYVQTEQGEYRCCYYVRTADGLLQAAETWWQDILTYEAIFSGISADPGEDSLFLLPDGSELS